MSYINKIKYWLQKNRSLAIIFLVIFFAGIFVRFYDLDKESLWLDEASSLYESTLSIPEMAAHSNQPPLYFLLLAWWTGLWGTGEAALRSLSAIFGILAIVFIFFTGRELFNTKTGLIAGFITAISQFCIYHSQDTRAYSLLLLLSLISYFLFIKMLKQGRRWQYPLYFISTFLLCYTHIYGLFIVFSQLVYLAIFRAKYKTRIIKLFLTFAGLFITLVPLVFLLGSRALNMAEGGFWIQKPGIGQIVETFMQYSSGFSISSLSPRTGLDAVLGNIAEAGKYILIAVFVIMAVASFLVHQKRRHSRKERSPKTITAGTTETINSRALLVIWLFVTILIPFLASQFVTPFYLPRYTIGGCPAFYLMAAFGVANLGRKTCYTFIAIITIFCSTVLYNYYAVDIKEQWREAALQIQTKSGDADFILFCEPYVQLPFDYYYKGNLEEIGINSSASNNDIIKIMSDQEMEKQRLWFVLSNVGQPPQVLNYLNKSYRLIEYTGYRGIIIYLFELSGAR